MDKSQTSSAAARAGGFRDPKLWAPVALVLVYLATLWYATYLFAPSDDTFIYLVYVKNLLAGKGLTFNGDKVEGFTSILWTMMIWVVGKLGMALPRAANLLSGASALLALIATYYLGRRMGLSAMRALAATALLATAGDFAFYAGNGLETVFFTAMVTFSLGFLFVQKDIRFWPSLGIPLVLAGTILARPDGLLVAGLVMVFLWVRTRDWKLLVRTAALIVVVILPVELILKSYYGYWVPNTFYAKAGAGLANVGQGLQYLVNFLNWAVLFLLAIVYIVAFRFGSLGRARWGLVIMFFGWLAHITVQGGDNMVGFRAFVPVMPLMYLLVVKGFEDVRPRVAVVLVCFACFYQLAVYNYGNVYGSSWNVEVKQQAEQWRLYHDYRKDIGLFLRERMEPDEVVALNAAGVLPYYSELKTIDMLGLNNEYLAHNGKRDRSMPYGHQVGDGQWVLEQEPDLILLGGAGSKQGDRFFADEVISKSPYFFRHYEARELPHGFIGYFRVKPLGRRVPPPPVRR